MHRNSGVVYFFRFGPLNKKIQNLLTKGIVGLEVNCSRSCKNFMKDIISLWFVLGKVKRSVGNQVVVNFYANLNNNVGVLRISLMKVSLGVFHHPFGK